MAGESARVVAREETRVSPWVRIVGKTVDFGRGGKQEIYHCIAQADYVAILARTASGQIPIVRQFRPAVEEYTWELPAGLLEPGESHEEACRRELAEEVGVQTLSLRRLGSTMPDTGRLNNRMHAFAALTGPPDEAMAGEPGIDARFVMPKELRHMIRVGEFVHQLHLGVLALAAIVAPDEWGDVLLDLPNQASGLRAARQDGTVVW